MSARLCWIAHRSGDGLATFVLGDQNGPTNYAYCDKHLADGARKFWRWPAVTEVHVWPVDHREQKLGEIAETDP